MDLKVVVAKYKESVSWTDGLNKPFVVFNKDRNDDHLFGQNLPNMGRETDTFLKYVVDNYEKLPDYVAFLQGDPFDHCFSAVETINGFVFDRPFEALGCVYNRDNDHILKTTLDWAAKCGVQIISPIKFISGMQCIVSKNLIRKRSEGSYRNIYEKVSKKIDHNCYTGYLFEYLWPTILGFNDLLSVGCDGC